MESHSFGRFSFLAMSGALARDGAPVPLGQRSAALLRLLLAERGAPVAKAALMDAAWGGAAVEESHLTVQMAALRKTIGKAPAGGDWIVTVPRVGYRFIGPDEEAAQPARGADLVGPSIAVLPFANLGGDPAQDHFVQGLAHDLIADLSKVAGLKVIAGTSSFAAAGRDSDPVAIASTLGVQYIVQGSVRRAADRVRVNAQLVDAARREHVWADRVDSDLGDVFALQDQVAGNIVAALADRLPSAHVEGRRRPVDPRAYDLFVRGRATVLQSPDGYALGSKLLTEATNLAPDFAEPHAWLAFGAIHSLYLWGSAGAVERAAAIASARRAVALDERSVAGYVFLGHALVYEGELDAGAEAFARALAIDPNAADAWVLQGEMKTHTGDLDGALADVRSGYALNPYPPGWYYWARGWVEFARGDYEDAIASLSDISTRRSPIQRLLASALAQVGRIPEARREAAEFLASFPEFTITRWRQGQPRGSLVEFDRIEQGYRLAGLPD